MGQRLDTRRIAIVHEWFDTYAGSERVVEQLLAMYPHADLFACVDFLPVDGRAFLQGKPVHTTFIQRLPFARRQFRNYLPLMPLAIEQLDVSGYDLVISSSHAVSKGVITGPHQLHVSYVHSPIRYAWDLQHQYLAEARMDRGPKSMVARAMLHYLRLWDLRTANGVDHFVANSDFIRRRIRKVYRREAEVIHPPVEVERFALPPAGQPRDNVYLTASRMVPYKRMPLIVEAFSRMPDLKLLVVGDGPELPRVKEKAGPNVELLGYLPQHEMLRQMQRARAFVFAAEEDFGITPVEAQACGLPVIAFGRGGSLETVRGSDTEGATGLFFGEQTVESIVEAVRRFEREAHRFHPEVCRAHAEQFSVAAFRQRMGALVNQLWADHIRSGGSVREAADARTPPHAG
jgi:glycosyltransferase involved in cell wall biosynthesis